MGKCDETTVLTFSQFRTFVFSHSHISIFSHYIEVNGVLLPYVSGIRAGHYLFLSESRYA